MGRSETSDTTLEEARERFEEWRSTRRGKGRIPAELWSAAVEVARREGVNRTARELHVAWDDLKRRLAGAKETRQTPAAAFVELVTPPEASFSECTIELEGSGRTLRIRLKSASSSHVAALSRELWEMAF